MYPAVPLPCIGRPIPSTNTLRYLKRAITNIHGPVPFFDQCTQKTIRDRECIAIQCTLSKSLTSKAVQKYSDPGARRRLHTVEKSSIYQYNDVNLSDHNQTSNGTKAHKTQNYYSEDELQSIIPNDGLKKDGDIVGNVPESCNYERQQSSKSPEETYDTLMRRSFNESPDSLPISTSPDVISSATNVKRVSYTYTKHLSGSSRPENVSRPRNGNASTNRIVRRLIKLLNEPTQDINQICNLYLSLPQPRMAFLPPATISIFLTLLRSRKLDKPRFISLFLTVVNDLEGSRAGLGIRDLNSAMHWVGRSIVNPTEQVEALEKALKVFNEIENSKIHQADTVTFNTIGDITLRAGKLHLTKSFLNQIKLRHLQEDRYTHLLRIAYHGARGSPQGVKNGYRSMIEAGELIDTIALNCVIKNLLQTGDEETAELALQRMKDLHDEKTKQIETPIEWQGLRKLGYFLKYSAWQLNEHPTLRKQIQDAAPIAPNIATYGLFIKYYARHVGDYVKMVSYLDEMSTRGLFPNSAIFFHIFVAFQWHSDALLTDWRMSNLHKIFRRFVEEVHRSEASVSSSQKSLGYMSSRRRPNMPKGNIDKSISKLNIDNEDSLVDIQQEHSFFDQRLLTAVVQAFEKCGAMKSDWNVLLICIPQAEQVMKQVNINVDRYIRGLDSCFVSI